MRGYKQTNINRRPSTSRVHGHRLIRTFSPNMIRPSACPHCSRVFDYVLIATFLFRHCLTNDHSTYGFDRHRGLQPAMSFGTPMQPNQYDFFVGILFAIRVNGEFTGGGVCSGTLITKEIVITAGHCAVHTTDENRNTRFWTYEESKLLEPDQKNKTFTLEVFREMCGSYAESYARRTEVKRRRRTLSNYVFHPKLLVLDDKHSIDLRYDVMLLFLEKPYDEVVEFPKLYGCRELLYDPAEKKKIEIKTNAVGCGNLPRTDKNSHASGLQHDGKEPHVISVTAFQEEGFCVNQINLYPDKWTYVICNKPNRAGVCAGDSGGPLFYNPSNGPVPYLIGTLSGTLTKYCGPFAFCGCHKNKGYHVLLYKHKEWIKKEANVDFYDCTSTKQSRLSLINFNVNRNSQATGSRGQFTLNLLMIIACEFRMF